MSGISPILLLLLLSGLLALGLLPAPARGDAYDPADQATPEQSEEEFDPSDPRPSRCAFGCSLLGTCNEEMGRCDCPRHRHGPACQETVKRVAQVCAHYGFPDVQECIGNGSEGEYRRHHLVSPCLNDCNGLGRCISGWCHCKEGFFGADCSLSLDAEGKAQLLAGQGYVPRQKRPWVFVYELPPRYTTWHNVRRMDRPLHFLFWQRLLSSGARVANAEDADIFFLPFNLRMPSQGDLFVKALDHLRTRWPWMNKFPERHFVIHTGDVGRIDVSVKARTAGANLTWLTHWGLHKDHTPSGWVAAHRLEKDFVIPTYLPAGDGGRSRVFLNSPFHPKAPKPAGRGGAGGKASSSRYLQLSFAGRICGDRAEPRKDGKWPNCGVQSRGYSQEGRQKVHYFHHNRTGYSIRVSDPNYNKHMLHSRFCLAPTGGGFGHRQILVTVAGCAPAVVSDDVLQPLQPALDWRDFSLDMRISDAAGMHKTIAAVTEAQYESMQVALRCVTQHFIYSSIIGGFMGEDGKYDAFESVLEVLRVKAAHPGALQHTYADIDPDFRRFMHCGADSYEEAAVEMDVAAAAYRKMAAAAETAPGPPPVPTGELKPTAGGPGPLCSISAFDGDPYPCRECSSQAQGFVPGGSICCGFEGKLASCHRPWA